MRIKWFKNQITTNKDKTLYFKKALSLINATKSIFKLALLILYLHP